ncbi:MAG: energy transducer TonB [Gammaproteobacteria bacterium]|nr:energy transducer TonB [Gammaproteobacteria bacterium]MBU1777545.1 energy transducer TonB [Gammaproteobacteria bacterium]MBU1968284.1 energy transducer TonB [Gammaproteobacteria bacterium]
MFANAAGLLKQPITFGVAFSISLHAFLLFGIALVLPDIKQIPVISQPLEVVLVNSASRNRPSNASAYAQSNLDGGGNFDAERRAKTPFPVLGNDKRFTPEQTTQRLRQLEQETKRMLTRDKSDYRVAEEMDLKHQTSDNANGHELVQRSLEIARLEAQISKSLDMYEKMPRRKFIGARTQEYRYAQYVEDWRAKVERIGNLNYPEIARREKIYGKLTLTVSIRADGSVESIEINRPSGQRILDASAVRIVKLSAPFAPFPPDIRKELDILHITRTWIFTSTDRLESE